MEDKKELKVEELETASGGIVQSNDKDDKIEKKVAALKEIFAKGIYYCSKCTRGGPNNFVIDRVPDTRVVKYRCTNCNTVFSTTWESFGIKY